jgi:hypothetical protein
VDTAATNIVYTLVGIAGLYGLYLIATVSRGTLASRHGATLRNTDRDAPITHDGRAHARH